MKNKYFLFILVAVLATIDAVCTLVNAKPEYWSNYSDYGVEYNPLGAWALHQGPIIYLLFVALWIFVIFLLLKYLPHKIGVWIGAAFWLGHSIGGLGTQGTYVVYSQFHIGTEDDLTPLILTMMLITVVSTSLFVYGFLKFLGYDIVAHKVVTKKSSKSKR